MFKNDENHLFVCIKKPHGIDIQFYVDSEVQIKNRDNDISIIELDIVKNKYNKVFIEIFKMLKKLFPDLNRIVIYGKIQSRLSLYLFNIYLCNKKIFLDYEKFENIMSSISIDEYPKIIYMGSLKDCLKFNMMKCKISKKYNLNDVIIKPYTT